MNISGADADSSYPLRVLGIDDDVAALEILDAYCSGAGFRFFSLDTPAEAVDFALTIMPDVILTDAMMPGIDGFELCRRFRARRELALIPILMITSLDGRERRIEALEAGAQDFLTKPVDRLELTARVRALGRTRRLTETLDSAERVLDSIALCAEARDHTTGEHCERLRMAARNFGEFLGLDRPDLLALERAGYLHDIGKIAIPDAVLHKPGPLNDEEWAIMKTHPTIGADLLAPLSTMSHVLPIVRYHHERWDGRGYPAGLRGDQIPFLARVFQLIDAWDALTNSRPYKRALTPDQARELLVREGTEGRWDPALLDAFLRWQTQPS